MLRSALRRLPLRSLIRSPRVSIIHSPGQLICRQYTDKKPPSDNAKPPSVSDYIASQPPPFSAETPPDRMPHQTGEDVATEKIYRGEPRTRTKDGLSVGGIPVEDVFNENLEVREKAPEAIKHDDTSTAEGIRDIEEVKGRCEILHVTEESIAFERISSGDASGAEKRAPGSETPVSAIFIEEIVGDGEKPTVIDESFKDNDEQRSIEQAVRRNDRSTSTTTAATEESSSIISAPALIPNSARCL